MEDSIFDHPEYKRLQDAGFGDVSQQQRTFVIYLDLIEIKGWYNVKLCPVEKLETVFVTGHPTSTDENCLVWPVSAASTVSINKILSVKKELQNQFTSSRMMMGIVDSDSTVVYYQLSSDLVPPEAPHELQAAKDKLRRKVRRRRMKHRQTLHN